MSGGLPEDGKFHSEIQKSAEMASKDLVYAMDWVNENARKYGFDTKAVAWGGS